MSEDQLRQFFRQKIGSLTTGKDVRDAFNALLDFVLAQGGTTPEPTPEPEPEPSQKRMAVCLLDSITFGTGADDPATESWPAQFAVLAASHYGLVVNLGVPGNNTSDGIARLASITTTYNFTDYAGVDVYCLEGVNDFLLYDRSVATVEANYPTMFAGLKAPNPAKVRIFQFTLPAAQKPEAPLAQARINDLNAAIRTKAVSTYGATAFIDLARRAELQDPTDQTYYADPVHPNKAGYAVIASAVLAYLTAGTQPSGPILTNTPAPVEPGEPEPAATWVAPATGNSAEYDVQLPEWAFTGQWSKSDSTTFYADASGVLAGPGATYTSPTLLTRTVRVVAALAEFGGQAKLELLNTSGAVVATQTVSMQGANGPATFSLSLASVQVVRFRLTVLTEVAFLSGIILSRSAN